MKRLWRSTTLRIAAVALLALLVLQFLPLPQTLPPIGQVGPDGKWEIRIGPVGVEAAGTADYTTDGVDDHVQVQAAVNALPAAGGRIQLLAGTYVWGAGQTVTRAINNVTIEGVGRATYLTGDGVTALFSVGAQSNWVFRNLRTDAGGITDASSTMLWENVTAGATYYAYRTANQAFNSTIATGTSPFTVSSTTKVSNLNADTVDGYQSGRGATLTVAASDASAQEIAQADYVADGTADDVQIQAAIDVVEALGFGSIYLTAGHFVGGTITIQGSGIRLYGAGPNATTYTLANGVNNNVLVVGDNGVAAYNNVVLDNITIDGNKANQAGVSSGLVFDRKISYSYATNIRVVNALTYGVEFDGTGAADADHNITLENFVIESSGSDNIYGNYAEFIRLRNSPYIYAAGQHGVNLQNGASHMLSDLRITSSTARGISWGSANSQWINVNVAGSGQINAYFSNLGVNTTVTNAVFENAGTISVYSDGAFNSFVNSYIPYGNRDGYYFANSNNSVIGGYIGTVSRETDNTWYSVQVVGGADNTQIIGVEFDGDRLAGNQPKGAILIAAGSDSNIITSNVFSSAGWGTAIISNAGLANIFKGNVGYIGKGESQSVAKAITAGVQGTVTSIQNTFGGDVLITEAYVAITTAASATNPTYDLGTDDDGAGAPSVGNNLFNAIPDTAAYYRSTSAGLGGDASGVQVAPILWQAVGNDWVNFIISTANGADTAGTIYITVMGA